MKHILAVLLFLFICVAPACAEDYTTEVQDSYANETVDVGASEMGGADSGDALIQKTQEMAGSLHSASKRAIVPIVIIIILVCGLLGVFIPIFRLMGVFALVSMVIIMWAPQLVSAVANWVRL